MLDGRMTTLAFGFVSPWLLWGLLLGGVPILIQWLHRRNYTERVWAAMRFLQAATKSQSRRLRLESLLLLLIRTLILVLAALALAEPFLESAGWLPMSDANVHRLIVLDTSLSMQYEAEGRALSERAREAARSLVAASQPGDSFQIVTVTREGHALVRQPAFDSAEVLAEIGQLHWTEEFGGLTPTLELARGLLEESPPDAQPQVTIISDFQRSNWWPDAQWERTRMQRAMTELAEEAELSIVQVGIDEPANAAITDLQVDPSLATVGTPVSVTAKIQRRRGASDSLAVELVENNRVLQTKTAEIPADGEANVVFTTVSRDPGERRLEIRLPRDALAADNHRWATIKVRNTLAVLLVNGRESGASLGQATDFVEVALAPTRSTDSDGLRSVPGVMGYRPVVVKEAEFAGTDLSAFDCVFLCDVPFLSEIESARLDRFVRAGGGLVIGLGGQVRPDAYNHWLSAAGGLMPVQLLRIAGEEELSPEPFHFAEPASRHPIVEPFLGNPQAGLTTANIYRYYETRLREEEGGRGGSENTVSRPGRDPDDRRLSEGSDLDSSGHAPARVALAFASGDPAIIEHESGAGRVLLVTTSLDDRWGSWALWPSFLPMVHRMVQYAASGRTQRSLVVGDRLRREYPIQTVGLPVTVQRPDGRRSPGRSTLDDGATAVTFAETSQSGIYRLVLGPPLNETELIAVNIDPRESDLRTLDERELASTLLAGIDAQLRTPGEQLAEPHDPGAPERLFTHWLLFVVLILLVVEQVMAWNARYGLAVLAASPLLVAGFIVLPTASVVLVLAGLGGLLLRRRGVLRAAR